MIKQEQKQKYLSNRKYTNELPGLILCFLFSVGGLHLRFDNRERARGEEQKSGERI